MGEAHKRLKGALADRYQLKPEIGRGGMATVYLADDLKHRRQVAIKILKPELATAIGVDRFLREIEVSAGLHHPHILPLYDSGEAEGFLYYVMPYVEGESLRERLNREKHLPIDEAVQIACEVADALSYAHSHDVIHRDIKPENILLASGHATVADFGIARAISAAGGEQLTETGIAVGTPAYMSPEQAAGAIDLDGRSDIYALGCVAYEMLASHPPFTGTSAQEILARHATDDTPSLAAARPAVSAGLEQAIATALAKTPADRFATAAKFADAIATPRDSARPRRLRRRAATLGVAGTIVVVTLFIFAVLSQVTRRPESTGVVYPPNAIAVLPFRNLSAEEQHGYFAEGLHQELMTQLARIGALSVRGRTSVIGYAGTSKSIKDIGDELSVGSIVGGSVQVVGDRLRVNVQLIDATADVHIWANRYDRTLDDAFAIQSEVAQRIVEAVGAVVSRRERRELAEAPTADAEAYRLYLQGLEYGSRRRSRENYEIQQQFYERALELDREFALAHAKLSKTHAMMHWYRYDTSTERVESQREEAEAALRLNSELPEAHVAMGDWYYYGRRDFHRALEEYQTAQASAPNDPEVLTQIAFIHRRLGDLTAVADEFEKIKQLNPRSAGTFRNLGAETFQHWHLYPEAMRAVDRALSLAPDLHTAHLQRGWLYLQWHGQLDTLRAAFDRVPREAEVGWLGTRTAQQLKLLLYERKPDSLLIAVAVSRELHVDGYYFFLPTSLYVAWAHELSGDVSAARTAFDAARRSLDSTIGEIPNDWRVHAARGHAFAGLGLRQQALEEARWLEQSPVYRSDTFDGPKVAEDRALILARAGNVDAAIDEVRRLLVGPSLVSVHTLRLDPRWDPIRDHARFQALLIEQPEP